MPKAKEPGLRGSFFVPDTNDLRPDIHHPEDREGDGREVLRYATGPVQFCPDYVADDSSIATSPASAQFTAGLPTRKRAEKSRDEGFPMVEGIRRP